MKLLYKVQYKWYSSITAGRVRVVLLLDYIFPEFKYLERPYMTQLGNSMMNNVIKCGAGILHAKKIQSLIPNRKGIFLSRNYSVHIKLT